MSDEVSAAPRGLRNHQLWVTPYREDDATPPAITPHKATAVTACPPGPKANRPIENNRYRCVVHVGFHHVPRRRLAIMPAAWHEFELRPFRFFHTQTPRWIFRRTQ